MSDIFDRAKSAGGNAPLKNAEQKKATGTRRKNLNMPVSLFDRHAALYASGKTTLDFSAFIMLATLEKMEALEG